MDKVRIVSFLMLALSAFVMLAPVLHALSVYEWDFQSLITPVYSPPKIDFSMRFVGVRVDVRILYSTFSLSNVGEVDIALDSLNATAYSPKGEAVASATLLKAVKVKAGSSENLTLKFTLNDAAVEALASYLMKDHVDLKVEGTAVVGVLGSKAIAPFSASFPLSRTDLGLTGRP